MQMSTMLQHCGHFLAALLLIQFAAVSCRAQTGVGSGSLRHLQQTVLSPAAVPAYPEWGLDFDYNGYSRTVVGNGGVVAADTRTCSLVGQSMLERGGNAVDAGVAVILCQGLINPESSGVGGGGFILIRTDAGEYEVIDAREEAPLGANETMYVGSATASTIGGLAIAVPLELKGTYLAHQRHGVLPWETLVQPAIDLAINGFPAPAYLVQVLLSSFSAIEEYPLLADTFLKKADNGSYRLPAIGEMCCQRPLFAEFLKSVAANGSDAMYNAEAAAMLAAEIRAAGGVIVEEDLTEIEPKIKAPDTGTALGANIVTVPLPSSGVLSITGLRILDEINANREPLAGAGVLEQHWLVETMKQIYALRLALGDPDYANVTDVLGAILSPEYALELESQIKDNTTQDPSAYGQPYNILTPVPEDHGTTHVSVVDSNQGAFAMTSTINTYFGSMVVSESTGIIFNNEMDDFSTPGVANTYGYFPSPANYIEPGKKPLSTMMPTMAEVNGQLRMVVGASGGSRILSTVLQTLSRVLADGMTPFQAISGARIHHQLLPNNAVAENYSPPFSNEAVHLLTSPITVAGLKARGHNVTYASDVAICQAVVVDPDTGYFTGVSDPRKDGAPAGYNATAPAPSLTVEAGGYGVD